MRPVAIPVVSIPIKRHHRHPSAGRTDFARDFTPPAAAGELRAAPQAPRVGRSALRRLERAEWRVSLETGILERHRAAGRGPTERTRSHFLLWCIESGPRFREKIWPHHTPESGMAQQCSS